MDTKEVAREQISALADGELADQYMEKALATLRDHEARADWEIYHQIGDVLRSDDMAVTMSPQFTARMFARLEAEPPIVAPSNASFAPESGAVSNPVQSGAAARSAPSFAKRWAASGMIAAAVATAAFVATPQLMVAMKGEPVPDNVTAVASTGAQAIKTSGVGVVSGQDVSAPATAAMPEGVILRDPRIDDYLLAHQRFSPSMYSTAQFARSATFETAPDK